MNKRIHGGIDTKHIECINSRLQKYRVRWDFQPHYNEEGEQEGVTYYEHEFAFKPSLKQIKEVVLAGYNKIIDEQIISGFMWNDMLVWLSTENQFNYITAYNYAMNNSGINLPITFKFGTTENPVYHTFETIKELSEFVTLAIAHVNTKLAEGWVFKDSIDWSVYNIE